MRHCVWIVLTLVTHLFGVSAEQCGHQADFKLCPEGQCCSQYGWCGTGYRYCDWDYCQLQCQWMPPPDPEESDQGLTLPIAEDITHLIPESLFEKMLLHRNEDACPANGFYTYDAFIDATKAFPGFASIGSTSARKREIAAFFAQTSFQTTGGSTYSPDGPYTWGYCLVEEIDVPICEWPPCTTGKSYHGRGPFQISHVFNYAKAGHKLSLDLLNNPDLVAKDPIVSFKTALWFWMTPQIPNMPSCHDVITEKWVPSPADISDKRLPGYGMITNIINGTKECGRGWDERVNHRVKFYTKYCDMLGVSYGDNIDCSHQRPIKGSLSTGFSLKKISSIGHMGHK